MEASSRLLRRGPESLEDIELQQRPLACSNPHITTGLQRTKRSYKVFFLMLIFWSCGLAFVIGHHYFFIRLDQKTVKETLSQNHQSAAANFFALFVDVSLIAGLGVAYNQILWSLLREKAFSTQVIDKLVHLHGSPWELIHPSILRRMLHIKRLVVITLLCAGIPFALVFPPGAVTTDFQNQQRETLQNVRTMNISDYGNGTIQQFVEHSLFEVNGDLNYNQLWVRPKLKAIAAQVLASGEPVKFDSPCGSACVYNISLDGPGFQCEEPEEKPQRCGLIYEAVDMAGFLPKPMYAIGYNAFKIFWDPKPKPDDCDLKSRRSLVCTMKLATYTLQIEHSSDASRSIETKVHNYRDVWTNDAWIQAQFFSYFFDGSGPRTQPAHLDELHTNFTNSQAFAIRQVAIDALTGEVDLMLDAGALSFHGNGTKIIGSQYIGLDDKYNPQFNISAKNIENFLQDVVISTLSLGTSIHDGDIDALVGAEVYLFNAKPQFYWPYGLCLGVALVISAYGALCWWRNGSSAGSSFLQFATTTVSSKALNRLASQCPGGDEGVSKELKELELKFVNGSFVARNEMITRT
ncbi:unnamed protein product [Fusarium venenatum]|uniref:Uncharacterized protein n=1 Tax=Fusarium venenatum TaxID=56646 RepID=A0A2L2TZ52_9HYPO|nr:uncharacterized protein FVRRES_10463 [Fusarium venenatum]KAH6967067.1 hypothetical protein EDB82DRAFT_530750 [Fusarium venenatum]CEI70386.1 unnamed protein product [Fusarium venenatum]